LEIWSQLSLIARYHAPRIFKDQFVKMTDKLSSPSSSTLSGSANTPGKGNGGSEEYSYLAIRKQPPSYVFPDEAFEIDVSLDVSKGSKQSDQGDVDIVATLEDTSPRPQASPVSTPAATLIILDGTQMRVSPNKRGANIRCRIKSTRQGGTFCIRIAAKDDREIIPGTTTAIHLVEAKIKVSTTDEWDNIWYKDEGGRDKSMELIAEAYDKDNQVVREKIALNLTLFYDSEIPVQVSNQDLLKAQGSERKLQLDKSTGRARIRFRIEDVSKNHQGQNFILRVAADKRDEHAVAPGFSPAVSVRSKRNKRHRVSSSLTSGGRGTQGPESSSPTMMRSSPIYADHPNIPLEGVDSSRLRDAIQGVMHWTDEVVNGLYSLQWQVIGYAQHPDGSPDYSRPYHSMPNPNPLIAQVLSRYTDSVRGNLRLVQQAVDQADIPRRRDDATYNTMAPAVALLLPRESEGMYGIMPPPGVQRTRSSPPPAASGNLSRSRAAAGMVPLTQGPPPSNMHSRESPFRDFPQVQQRPGYYPQHNRPQESDNGLSYASLPQPSQHLRDGKKASQPSRPRSEPGDSLESEVEFVLAKQYKSMQTSERLGFPAYSVSKELLGFYRESSTKVGVGQFVPIRHLAHEFGPLEVMQATEILEEALATNSDAVHALKDWGSINNLIDHALVYDWTKDIDGANNQTQPAGGSRL
jgi:hypothetical protein